MSTALPSLVVEKEPNDSAGDQAPTEPSSTKNSLPNVALVASAVATAASALKRAAAAAAADQPVDVQAVVHDYRGCGGASQGRACHDHPPSARCN